MLWDALNHKNGGWGGIRTHERVAPLPVFKTGAFNRSTTHPVCRKPDSILRHSKNSSLLHIRIFFSSPFSLSGKRAQGVAGNWLPTLFRLLPRFPPIRVTTPRTPAATSAAIMAYSMAVAPQQQRCIIRKTEGDPVRPDIRLRSGCC